MKPCRPSSASAAPLKPSRDQGGGDQAVHRRPADLEALGPGAVREELQAAGALAQRGAERAFDLPGIEPEHPRGRRRRAERAAGRGRVEAAVVMCSGGQGERDAAGDLIARDDGRQHVGSARAGHSPAASAAGITGAPGCSEPAAWVSSKSSEWARAPFRKAAPAGRVARRVAKHPVVPGGEAERPRGGEQRGRALRVIAGADDVADEVEDQKARALHDLGRQAVERDPGGE